MVLVVTVGVLVGAVLGLLAFVLLGPADVPCAIPTLCRVPPSGTGCAPVHVAACPQPSALPWTVWGAVVGGLVLSGAAALRAPGTPDP